MKYVYTFAEVGGSRLAATADRDGANLPGGYTRWRRTAKLEASEMSAGFGVTGLENTVEILEDVRTKGLYLTASTSEG